MIVMAGKSKEELCAAWHKYQAIKEANEQMVQSMLDDINDALYAADPQAGYAFTKALGRDPGADPAEYFEVDAPTVRRRRN